MHKPTQKEIDLFHMRLRKKRYERNNGNVCGIGIYNAFHYVLLPFIKLLRILRKQKLIVIADRHDKQRKKSVIYACTHIGGNDVECLFETIKSLCYLFLGDPRELYVNFDGLMLYLNGVICLDSYDKEDCYIAKQTAISLLKRGGSLMIYPEGAWNITENLPVMPLFAGTAEIAIAAKAEIVPVAIERYDSQFYVIIGQNIKCDGYTAEEKLVLTETLHNALVNLKWEIWEHMGLQSRSTIEEGYGKVFVKEIINEKETSYTVQDVYDTRFRLKGVTELWEVFAYLEKLEPKKENAFLWRDKKGLRECTTDSWNI